MELAESPSKAMLQTSCRAREGKSYSATIGWKHLVVDVEDIEATIENIRRAMQNLYNMAEKATDDETMVNITERMNNLEKQKRDAEALLYDLEDEEEELAEIVKFEQWAEKVRPLLANPSYTPSYEELRLAVRILGIRVTVYPTAGEWPYRYKIDVTVPAIIAKLHCVTNDPTLETSPWYVKAVM